jgi:hypothetical protein
MCHVTQRGGVSSILLSDKITFSLPFPVYFYFINLFVAYLFICDLFDDTLCSSDCM